MNPDDSNAVRKAANLTAQADTRLGIFQRETADPPMGFPNPLHAAHIVPVIHSNERLDQWKR